MTSQQSNNAPTPEPLPVPSIDIEKMPQQEHSEACEDSPLRDATAAEVTNHTHTATPTAMTEAQQRNAARLREQISTLESKIASMQQEKTDITAKLRDDDAAQTVKNHIRLLHRYNEIKDVGMGLLGMIAEQRGVRVKEVMEEFTVGEKD